MMYKKFTLTASMASPKSTTAKKKTKTVRGETATGHIVTRTAATGKLHLFTSSEARRDWKKVTSRALAGERVAIMIGKQAVALRPVELTFAEEEYGVTETELHGKAQEILGRARKERAQGKTGSCSNLL